MYCNPLVGLREDWSFQLGGEQEKMKELTDELTALLNTSSTASGMHCVFNNLMMLSLTHSDQDGSDTDLLLAAAGNIGRAMAGFVNTVDGLVHYNVCCVLK